MATYSASYIPPQQKEWIREAMQGGLWDKLPVELLDHTLSLSAVMTRKEADEYRKELMEERKVFVTEHDSQYFGQASELALIASCFLLIARILATRCLICGRSCKFLCSSNTEELGCSEH
jgi:hypothetical protein